MSRSHAVFLITTVALLAISAVPLAQETVTLTPAKVKKLLLSQGIGVRLTSLSLDIKRQDLDQIHSRFDTLLSFSGDHLIDKAARSSTFFGRRIDTTHWNVEVDKTFASGTTLGVSFLNERKKTFGASALSGVPAIPTYEPVLEFSLKQSLLENSLGRMDRAEIRGTRETIAAFDFQTQYEINRLAVEAVEVYWRWVIALEKAQVSKEALGAAQDFLRLTLEKEKLGTAEKTDRLGALALVAKREAGFSASRGELDFWETQLKTKLGISRETPVVAALVFVGPLNFSQIQATQHALAHRADLLSKRHALEASKMTLIYAKNKRWPALDLESTLRINEIRTDDYEGALGEIDNPKWSVGLTLKIPLENRAARGLKNKASYEKMERLLEIQDLENKILHEVPRKYQAVLLRQEAWEASRRALFLQGDKLGAAIEQFLRGRFSGDLILKYQDDYLGARLEALEAKLNHALAVLALKEEASKDL